MAPQCCNPFNVHNSVTKGLRILSSDYVEKLINQGIFWVSTKSLVCRDCRQRISEISDHPRTPPILRASSGTTPQATETSPLILDTSLLSSKTPSTDESTKAEYNNEQIRALAQHLKLQVPIKTTFAASSSSFRTVATQELYGNIIQEINKLFHHTNAISDDAKEMIDNLVQAFENAETTAKKIDILKLLPASLNYEQIRQSFKGATTHMIQVAKRKTSEVVGVIPLSVGRQPISEEAKNAVVAFYLRG